MKQSKKITRNQRQFLESTGFSRKKIEGIRFVEENKNYIVFIQEGRILKFEK